MTMVVCTITLPPPITYDYVDLGLPSGTKWATQNVGARKPSDFGLYFQWGDTKGYAKDQVGKDKQFTWNDYKWNPSGDGETFTKYTTYGDTLELEDDAANANMGGDWHMPTPEQIRELIDNTTDGWTNYEGVGGWKFISKNDSSKYIFIPAAGIVIDGSIRNFKRSGVTFSTKLNNDDISKCIILHFISDYGGSIGINGVSERYEGLTIRGVIDG